MSLPVPFIVIFSAICFYRYAISFSVWAKPASFFLYLRDSEAESIDFIARSLAESFSGVENIYFFIWN